MWGDSPLLRISRVGAFVSGFAYMCYLRSDLGTTNRAAEYQKKKLLAKVHNNERLYANGKVYGK